MIMSSQDSTSTRTAGQKYAAQSGDYSSGAEHAAAGAEHAGGAMQPTEPVFAMFLVLQYPRHALGAEQQITAQLCRLDIGAEAEAPDQQAAAQSSDYSSVLTVAQ